VKERGLGSIYRPKYKNPGGALIESGVWWIRYSYRGTVHRESSKSRSKADAVRLLKKRQGDMAAGRAGGPDIEKTTFDDLAKLILTDYEVNGRPSIKRLSFSISQLRNIFGDYNAMDITHDRILSYIKLRKDAGAENATINRELAALKRMFNLGKRALKVGQPPYIPMLKEDNVRKGFFEYPEYQAFLDHLPTYLQPVMETAYITGWRIKSEILTRLKIHLDMSEGWLRLDTGETKNGEGRQFPLIPELRRVMEDQLARTRELERNTGRIIPWLFHRDGQPIKDFRYVWDKAKELAAVPDRIPHDFRRTAVRNLERAGVPRSVAMKLVGHKTESMYRRYAIVEESDMKEAAEKLAALQKARRFMTMKVVPLRPAANE